MFYKDGTYSREEDLAHYRVDSTGNVESILIKINELIGTWNRNATEVILNDKEVKKYTCKNSFGDIRDIEYGIEELPFGLDEYLIEAVIIREENNEIYYRNGG